MAVWASSRRGYKEGWPLMLLCHVYFYLGTYCPFYFSVRGYYEDDFKEKYENQTYF